MFSLLAQCNIGISWYSLLYFSFSVNFLSIQNYPVTAVKSCLWDFEVWMTLSSWTSLGISHKPFLDGSMCHWWQGSSENLAYRFLFRCCNYLGDLFAQWLQFPLLNRPYLINSLNHVYKYDCRALCLMPNYSVSCWSLLQICCILLNNWGNYTTGMSISW